MGGIGAFLANPSVWKIGGFILVIALGYFAIDGHFKSVERMYADKDDTITELREQVAGLAIDLNMVKLSNVSLEGEISTLQYSITRVISETKIIIESDNSFNVKVSELERVIADQVRNDRILSIREGRKAELLLNFVNSNVECWIQNFDNTTDGRCVMGSWRLNVPENITGR